VPVALEPVVPVVVLELVVPVAPEALFCANAGAQTARLIATVNKSGARENCGL
jgi:hypothetical protein